MKITIAEVKRRLKIGTEFTGEFVGSNAKVCKPGMQITQRRVTKNNKELESLLLDGPNSGQKIYLNWTNVVADERDGSIFLALNEEQALECVPQRNPEFLKITLTPACDMATSTN